MRYEKLELRNNELLVPPPSWPVSSDLASLSLVDAAQPRDGKTAQAEAVPDVPAAAGKIIVAAYAVLLAALAIATTGPGRSLLDIAVASFFLLMFFAVPAVFLRIERGSAGRVSFDRFMDQGMMTLNGHCTGSAALIQMLVVPVLLTGGAIAIGIAKAIIF